MPRVQIRVQRPDSLVEFFFWFSSVLRGKHGKRHKIGHGQFLPHPLPLNIHILSILCNLGSWKRDVNKPNMNPIIIVFRVWKPSVVWGIQWYNCVQFHKNLRNVSEVLIYLIGHKESWQTVMEIRWRSKLKETSARYRAQSVFRFA